MKKSTQTLLLVAAGIGGYLIYKRKKLADATAAATASAAPAIATASAATPSEVVAASSLAGSSLSGHVLASRAGMGVFA